MTYVVMGSLFFFGGLMINVTKNDKDPIKAASVFAAIFPIMFGAFSASGALAMATEVGKA